MKLRIIAGVSLALVGSSFGAVGYFGNLYVVTTANGGGLVFNQVTSPANNRSNAGGDFTLSPDGANPALGSFGNFNTLTGQTLVLKGFEMNTFNDNGDSVNSASVFYRVTKSGDTPGSFSSISLGIPTNTAGNNKLWQKTDGAANLTSGLSDGNYTINFYVQNDANGGGPFTMNNWNSSSGPSATFTVVPEPSAAFLGAIGSLILLRRRR